MQSKRSSSVPAGAAECSCLIAGDTTRDLARLSADAKYSPVATGSFVAQLRSGTLKR